MLSAHTSESTSVFAGLRSMRLVLVYLETLWTFARARVWPIQTSGIVLEQQRSRDIR